MAYARGIEGVKDIREHICSDKAFWGVAAIASKNVADIKAHVPFLLYNRNTNETIVILNAFTHQTVTDGVPSPVKTKLKYLKWEEWTEEYWGLGSWDDDYPEYIHCSGWVDHEVLIENFDTSNLCCGYLPTQKQFEAIRKENIYGLPEERALLTSGIEAHVRIEEHCNEMKKRYEQRQRERKYDYDGGWDEYEAACYCGPGPWGEGT